MEKKKNVSPEKLQVAMRLRKIREDAGLTQENFSEILGISLSAYKKIESGENSFSLSCMDKLNKAMNVSADYVYWGEKPDIEETWFKLVNSSETDKMYILLKLLVYFTKTKSGMFPLDDEESKEYQAIVKLLSSLQDNGET